MILYLLKFKVKRIMRVKLPALTQRTCPICGGIFETRRGDKVYCGNSCQQLAYLDRKKGIEQAQISEKIDIGKVEEENRLLKLELEAKRLERRLLKFKPEVEVEPKHEERKIIDSSSVLNNTTSYVKPIIKKCNHCKKQIYINLAIHFVKTKITIVGSGWDKPHTAYLCNTECEANYLKAHPNYRSNNIKK